MKKLLCVVASVAAWDVGLADIICNPCVHTSLSTQLPKVTFQGVTQGSGKTFVTMRTDPQQPHPFMVYLAHDGTFYDEHCQLGVMETANTSLEIGTYVKAGSEGQACGVSTAVLSFKTWSYEQIDQIEFVGDVHTYMIDIEAPFTAPSMSFTADTVGLITAPYVPQRHIELNTKTFIGHLYDFYAIDIANTNLINNIYMEMSKEGLARPPPSGLSGQFNDSPGLIGRGELGISFGQIGMKFPTGSTVRTVLDTHVDFLEGVSSGTENTDYFIDLSGIVGHTFMGDAVDSHTRNYFTNGAYHVAVTSTATLVCILAALLI